ncbi:hypothetical protein BKA56DRAFT_621405 [Ilyonectria sp. MPI-CAGE-AT-0026]|nr:hypothetical protein BKA56DRAFT_621405 [Ilyonectria sp. MPI-CAGE-AT-0026]
MPPSLGHDMHRNARVPSPLAVLNPQSPIRVANRSRPPHLHASAYATCPVSPPGTARQAGFHTAADRLARMPNEVVVDAGHGGLTTGMVQVGIGQVIAETPRA